MARKPHRVVAQQTSSRPIQKMEKGYQRWPRMRPRKIRCRPDHQNISAKENKDRPHVRGDCPTNRPCPWISCRHHLYLDIDRRGDIFIRYPHLEWSELRETCSLDVADRGPQTLEYIGRLLNLTRERVRQIEHLAMSHIACKRV